MGKILTIVIGLIIFLGCGVKSTFVNSAPTATIAAPTKQTVIDDLSLREIWRWSGHILNDPEIVIIEDFVVLPTWERDGHKIVVFDAQTGKPIWESAYIRNLRSLHADEERIYAGSITYVRSYDLQTGEILWEGGKQPDFKRGGLYVYPKSENLEVYDPSEGYLYFLELKTGQKTDEIKLPNLFFKQGSNYYLSICKDVTSNCFSAVDVLNERLLWSRSFKGDIFRWPEFTDDTMFINGGGELFAVRTQTGDIVWQSKESSFLTPAVFGEDGLYAIRDDTAIVGLDPETGKQVGVVEIKPKQDLTFKGGYKPYYTVAASNKYVVAYYSNSLELIVFEKID
jgi:outer membrane protein assembly factor BamB